jgi:hypothetical protein
MAFTTLASVKSGSLQPIVIEKTAAVVGSANCWTSHAYSASYSNDYGSIAAPSGGLSGTALTSLANTIAFGTVTGDLRVADMSTRYGSGGGSGCIIMLADRLWHNSGIVVTTTTAQTITSAAWPARDRNGSTDGEGVFVGLEVTTGLGNALNTTTTISYTNSSGTSGRTGTIAAIDASSPIGKFFVFRLDAGDTGVRSIQSITLGATLTSGAVSLVAFRPICMVGASLYEFWNNHNAFKLGFPKIYNESSLMLFGLPGQSVTATASITFAVG